MQLPEVKRVIYNKNPLDKVICQLQFPTILKIDSESPIAFQEVIRGDYPNLSESSEVIFKSVQDTEKQIPLESVQKAITLPGVKNFEFSSEAGDWKINLTRNFIALSTTNYYRWEEFKEKLKLPLKAFVDVYSPAYFTRIGLRYVDVFVRSFLGLEGVNWRELVNEHVLGILATTSFVEQSIAFNNNSQIKLDEEGNVVRLSAKTVTKVDKDEVAFMIDSDIFIVKKTERDKVLEKIDYFNAIASRLIRWCIKEKLHQAMEPKEI